MNDIIKYKNYIGSLHYSSEDEVFFGKIEGINDSITFEGQTVSELKKAFEEAVDDYLKMCELHNKAPDKTYKGSFNVRISPKLHRQAANKAACLGVSLNHYIEESIREYTVKKK
jgi:predicted HicB family RNase H-like nuclease